jgi:hypothetical protein
MVKWFLTVVFIGIVSSLVIEVVIVQARVTAAKVGLYG